MGGDDQSRLDDVQRQMFEGTGERMKRAAMIVAVLGI